MCREKAWDKTHRIMTDIGEWGSGKIWPKKLFKTLQETCTYAWKRVLLKGSSPMVVVVGRLPCRVSQLCSSVLFQLEEMIAMDRLRAFVLSVFLVVISS